MSIKSGIALLASEARTTSANGATVDIGARMTLRPDFEITAVAGTLPTIDLALDHSKTGNTWTQLGVFTQKTAAGLWSASYANCERYVRARWTLGGTSPSFTFSVTAEAQQFFIVAQDLRNELSPETLKEIFDDDNNGIEDDAPLEAYMIDAQSIVDGYVRGPYVLPVADPVPPILKTCTKHIAAAAAERRHPEYRRSDGADKLKTATDRLKEIHARTLRLDIAAEPIAFPNEAIVITRERRGWGE